MGNFIRARYETRRASDQTIVDIFKGAWKSRLPGGLKSGEAPMFEDTRPEWFNSTIPGGLAGKAVLELGPFEGYQTLAIHKLGAREIVSVEGNTVNFLKCLLRKEIDGINVTMKLGDVMEEISVDRQYDAVFASGILYHMKDPVRLIDLACDRADAIYIWTHYYDEDAMEKLPEDQKNLFDRSQDTSVEWKGRSINYHARTYGIESYEDNIPLYWEGAPQELTNWLELPDIKWVFEKKGFRLEMNSISKLNGLPVVSFAALRS